MIHCQYNITTFPLLSVHLLQHLAKGFLLYLHNVEPLLSLRMFDVLIHFKKSPKQFKLYLQINKLCLLFSKLIWSSHAAFCCPLISRSNSWINNCHYKLYNLSCVWVKMGAHRLYFSSQSEPVQLEETHATLHVFTFVDAENDRAFLLSHFANYRFSEALEKALILQFIWLVGISVLFSELNRSESLKTICSGM